MQNSLKDLDTAKPLPVSDEVREHYARIGKRGGATNAKKGPEYFSRIAKMKTGMKYKKGKGQE